MSEPGVSEQYPYGQDFLKDENQTLDEEDIYDQQDRIEDQQSDMEDVEWSNVPQQRKNDSLYTLFKQVWRAPDSSKVANLDKTELGPAQIMNVRGAQFMALIGGVTNHRRFAFFFNQIAESTLKTSASKKGWFTELFVSQKKSTSRFTGNPNFGQPQQFKPKRRFSLFGAGSNEQVQNEN